MIYEIQAKEARLVITKWIQKDSYTLVLITHVRLFGDELGENYINQCHPNQLKERKV